MLHADVGTHGSCGRTHIRIGNERCACRTHGPCVTSKPYLPFRPYTESYPFPPALLSVVGRCEGTTRAQSRRLISYPQKKKLAGIYRVMIGDEFVSDDTSCPACTRCGMPPQGPGPQDKFVPKQLFIDSFIALITFLYISRKRFITMNQRINP